MWYIGYPLTLLEATGLLGLASSSTMQDIADHLKLHDISIFWIHKNYYFLGYASPKYSIEELHQLKSRFVHKIAELRVRTWVRLSFMGEEVRELENPEPIIVRY